MNGNPTQPNPCLVLIRVSNNSAPTPNKGSPLAAGVGCQEVQVWTNLEGYYGPPPQLHRIAFSFSRSLLFVAVRRPPPHHEIAFAIRALISSTGLEHAYASLE